MLQALALFGDEQGRLDMYFLGKQVRMWTARHRQDYHCTHLLRSCLALWHLQFPHSTRA